MMRPSHVSWRSRSEAMLEAYPIPAAIIGVDFRVHSMNGACRDMVGARSLTGRTTCHELFHRCPVPTEGPDLGLCPLERCLRCRSPKQAQHCHHTVGGRASQLVTAYPLPDRDGDVKAALQTCHPFGEGEELFPKRPQVTHSETMRATIDLILRVADKEVPVLLTGESGTGRRELARLIHDLSRRACHPFVSVSCTGMPPGELRSELFGRRGPWGMRGEAFRIGLVDAGHRGTIYFEDVGDLGPEDQGILLRMLRWQVPHDIRMIFSTRHPVVGPVDSGHGIHPSLRFRISHYPVEIPPLRKRLDDLPDLARMILAEVEPSGRTVLEPETLEALLRYPFPGNLTELRSALIWATLMADGPSILPDHLPPPIH